MTERLELRYVDLATLRRWDRNAKRHDLGALAESITRHGFRDPPAYDPALNAGEGGIVEGNGRGDALSAMQAQGQPAPRGVVVEGGAWLVPVLFGVDAPSQAAAEAYGIAHNNLTMAGGDFTDLDMAGMWEPEGYAALLRSLAEQGEIPVSIDPTALDALLAGLAGTGEPGAGGDEFDATPDDGPTRCQAGDLWSIGGVHRLLVGDCTAPANVARLMQGERAGLCFADPPYGVDYDETWRVVSSKDFGGHHSHKVTNDTISDWTASYKASNCNVLYVWHASSFARKIADDVEAAGYEIRQQIIWVKPFGVMSRSAYNWQHEPCWYAVKKGATAAWKGDHKQTTVWEATIPNHPMAPDDDARTPHPTQKPIALAERAITNHLAASEIVYDPFLGSGTTMVAANNLGRRCFGCEIEPRYADVVLKRMESLGLSAVRVEDPSGENVSLDMTKAA